MLQAQSMKGRYDVLGGSTRSSSFRGQPTGNASVLHGQGEGKRGGRRRQEQQRGRVGVRGFGLGGGSRALRRVTKMPVAVPRVPYRTPQEGNWQWVDLWNCLYRERIIFVGQGISEELANQLVGTLLYLDSVRDVFLSFFFFSFPFSLACFWKQKTKDAAQERKKERKKVDEERIVSCSFTSVVFETSWRTS